MVFSLQDERRMIAGRANKSPRRARLNLGYRSKCVPGSRGLPERKAAAVIRLLPAG